MPGTIRGVVPQVDFRPGPENPSATLHPLSFGTPPGGMNTSLRLNMLSPSVSRLVENLVVRDGRYVTRNGTITVYDPPQLHSPLVYAFTVNLADGSSFFIRFAEYGIEYLLGETWTPVPGDVVASSTYKNVSITGWANTIVFTAGVGGIYSMAFDSGAPLVTALPDSPTNVRHVTTFNRRIIASHGDTTITWCVSGDNTKWDPSDPLFPGAGFEDLLSSFEVDSQTAVIPVSDDTALVIRANSVWTMAVTGDFDVPFRFTLLFSGMGTSFPATVVKIPRGAIFASQKNVYAVSLEGFKTIGDPIRRTALGDDTVLATASANYDNVEGEYRLALRYGEDQKVWRFNVPGNLWTIDAYPFGIRSIAQSRFVQALTIDQLEGNIDSLEGTIDELGVLEAVEGTIYAGTGNYVVRDSINTQSDVDDDGNVVPKGFRIETGYVTGANTVSRTSLVKVLAEYEADVETAVGLEVSRDSASWTLYSSGGFEATTAPEVASFERTLDQAHLQLALFSEDASIVSLLALHAFVLGTASIEDAR